MPPRALSTGFYGSNDGPGLVEGVGFSSGSGRRVGESFDVRGVGNIRLEASALGDNYRCCTQYIFH